MAPAFVAKLHNMLSCFLVVVVVDGGSEQQGKQQCMLWGGREEGANECLRSFPSLQQAIQNHSRYAI